MPRKIDADADAEASAVAPVAEWSRQIGALKLFCRAEVTPDKTWTFKIWLQPQDKDHLRRAPDLVFPTLLKDRQHAQRLMEMSLVDELSARAGMPRPFFDGPRSDGHDGP